MNKENLMNKEMDFPSLIRNRENLDRRLIQAISDKNEELQKRILVMIEAINFQVDSRGLIQAANLSTLLPIDSEMYPNLNGLKKTGGMGHYIEKMLPNPSDMSNQRQIPFPEESVSGEIAEKAKKAGLNFSTNEEKMKKLNLKSWNTGWKALVTNWRTDGKPEETKFEKFEDNIEEESAFKRVLDFLNKKNTSIDELVTFLFDLKNKEAACVGKTIDGIIDKFIFPVASGSIFKKELTNKKDIYTALVNDIVEPIFKEVEGAAPMAVFRLGFDFKTQTAVAYQLLITMIYHFSRMKEKDENKAISIQNNCWKSFVFNPEVVIKDPKIVGYYKATDILDTAKMIEDLANMSTDLSSEMLNEDEISKLKAAKNLIFEASVNTTKEVSKEIRELVKQDPPIKGQHPSKKGKNKKK